MDAKATLGVVKNWVSYHSEDRDVKRFPEPCNFEVEFPVEYKSVVSIRLSSIDMSVFHFSNKYQQNTSFLYNESLITIPDGEYNETQLALEITNQLDVGQSVVYNPCAKQFWFVAEKPFRLEFTDDMKIAAHLGFAPGVHACVAQKRVKFQSTSIEGNLFVAASHLTPFRKICAYFAISLYNCIDELVPFPERTNALIGAKNGGKHTSSFCKIAFNESTFQSSLTSLENIFISEPPLERLFKLRCRFRYHDGTLLDIREPFTFTLEITTLRNEFEHTYSLNRTNYKLT
jgi:hypothetical protein